MNQMEMKIRGIFVPLCFLSAWHKKKQNELFDLNTIFFSKKNHFMEESSKKFD